MSGYLKLPPDTGASETIVVSSQAEFDALGVLPNGTSVFRSDTQDLYVFFGGNALAVQGEASSVAWGNITGDIWDQTDLSLELQEIIPIDLLVPLLDDDYEFLREFEKIDGGEIT
jgi:hypothetical protein